MNERPGFTLITSASSGIGRVTAVRLLGQWATSTSGVTHISAANYPIFNLELGQLGFRVTTTFAVMRKLYGVSAPERVQQRAGALSLAG
jgi:hypothetical protein